MVESQLGKSYVKFTNCKCRYNKFMYKSMRFMTI